MRTIKAEEILRGVASLCVSANRQLPPDVVSAIHASAASEDSPVAREVFSQILENIQVAADTGLPLCQDTGLAVLFVEIGQEVHVDGSLEEALQEGVRKGYADGLLRKSLCDPFSRANTGDNTPAVIHYRVVPGDTLRIAYMAKGGGAENMSRVTMLAPADGWEGVEKFVLQRVADASSNPCPPIIVGLGIGGTFEYSAILAKKALLRGLDDSHPDPWLGAREEELREKINRLGIGPMGLGGRTTCLAVKILTAPCHIASLPLAVNIQCHSARHAEVEF